MAAGYVVETTVDVALVGATAKTVLMVINAANSLIRITELGISFDGIAAVNEPVTVELVSSTQAGAGTTTAQTPLQCRGPTRTVQATGARNYSVEPTTLSCIRRWLVHPQTGLVMQFPLGREPEQVTTADGLGIRCTAPVAVNCQGYLEFEEG